MSTSARGTSARESSTRPVQVNAPDHTGHAPRPGSPGPGAGRRLLITAGPTQEPIDAVRFIGNRSSGRLGVALADEGARRGWDTVLLLGPTHRLPAEPGVRVRRFRTTADLDALLQEEFHGADAFVQAAAVADYRPRPDLAPAHAKLRRTSDKLVLELEPTPDLLATCAARRREGQVIVGFALEPRDELMASAQKKLARKNVDLVVANPLETMDADTIEATVIDREGGLHRTPGAIAKTAFGPWLLAIVEARAGARV